MSVRLPYGGRRRKSRRRSSRSPGSTRPCELRLLPGLIQEALDKSPVHRRAPVVGADDPFDDQPLTIQQEAFGHTRCLIHLLDLGTAVLEDVEAQPQLLTEFLDYL